jgi:hypothetical protein
VDALPGEAVVPADTTGIGCVPQSLAVVGSGCSGRYNSPYRLALLLVANRVSGFGKSMMQAVQHDVSTWKHSGEAAMTIS